MKVSRLIASVTAALTLLTLLAMPSLASPQESKSLLATASGKGTLTVGREEFNVTSVVVKLNEDGTAEITVVTDLQLLVTGAWSKPEDAGKGIDLKITRGTTASVEGSGKLFLRPDGKSIDRLTIEGISGAKRKIQLNFVAEKNNEAAKAVASIFDRTDDVEAKDLCLFALQRIGNKVAKREMFRIYQDVNVAVKWRTACAEYLRIEFPHASMVVGMPRLTALVN